ncbi:MAG TPA: hypothetical protein VD908_18985 [Cytophagales bacterium]|nr:hypothetical protein [Cytophagales bacterium]
MKIEQQRLKSQVDSLQLHALAPQTYVQMKIKFHLIAVVLFAVCSLLATELQAQDKSTENKTTFSIETDPSTFAFNGYAFHIRIKPSQSKRLLIGAGTYALDFPGFLVNMNPENKDNDWNVRINSAYSLFAEYYFKEANTGWFVGLQTGVQNYKNTNGNIVNKHSKYSNFLVMPSIGYTWQPFKFPLYLKPWAGVGYTTKISGNNSIDEMTYNIAPFTSFVTLHLGYTFKL